MLKKFIVTAVASTIVTLSVVGTAMMIAVIDEDGRTTRRRRQIKLGDKIQWESSGQYMFAEPKKVVDIKDDPEHGMYVFVEGVTTGIPITEVVMSNSF